MYLVLIILLVLFLFGGLPNWGWHHYGYWPSGALGLILIILLVLVLARRI